MTCPCLLTPLKIPALKPPKKTLAVQLGRTVCIHRGPALAHEVMNKLSHVLIIPTDNEDIFWQLDWENSW